MKKLVSIIIALLGVAIIAGAVPARPGKFRYTQPDGSTVMVRLVGDEFGHWYIDEAGNNLLPDAAGYLKKASDTEISSLRSRAAARFLSVNAARRAGMAPSNTGDHKIPVLVVQFQNLSFKVTDPAEKFENLLNQEGYNYGGATGSVRDFFLDNSQGQYRPSFTVLGPVTVSENYEYYGGTSSDGGDEDIASIILDAAAQLDEDVDFSQFDSDADGYIDMVLVYYAGYNQAEGGSVKTIWPHQWSVYSSEKFDGVRFGSYFCTSELKGNSGTRFCGPATTCHEFSHSLGLPDFYDTDYESNGSAGGTYEYDTMAGGSYNNGGNTPPYFNAEERMMLGWLSSIPDLPARGAVTIPAISDDSQLAYKSPSSLSGEYFVYECRAKQKWDAAIPEEGLIVYHVDKSSTPVSIGYSTVTAARLWSRWESYNAINANGSHPCFYIIPAAAQNYETSYYGSQDSGLNYYNRWGTGYAFGTATGYDSYIPVDWSGVTMDYGLMGIEYSDGKVSFKMKTDKRFNYIDPGQGSYSAGDAFALELICSELDPPTVISWYYDGAAVSGSSLTLTAGTHTVSAELALKSGASQTVELELTVK